jgi:galactokinase
MADTQPVLPTQPSAERVAREFRQRYGEPSGIFRAPGRVNLIGEHTDYNDGFVMPAALGFYTYVAAGPRDDGRLSLRSLDFDETAEFPLDEITPGPTGHWSDYSRGVAGVLRDRGMKIAGANLIIKGDVPIGAGLSSSAAIEVATAFALLSLSEVTLDRRAIASACQRAEHEYAGAKCGIMDQFISCFGEAAHALLLDCRSLEYELLPVPASARIVVCNTMVKHELASGEYNLRRADCEAGVQILQSKYPSVRALRDATQAELNECGDAMPERVFRRCRHVITENERTLDAATGLRNNDLERFGRRMYESHASLRFDYEVSCYELDLMVDAARACAGVYGARMTGGGFGGCTVNLVKTEAVEAFQRDVAGAYERATGIQPAIYICAASEGAGPVKE